MVNLMSLNFWFHSAKHLLDVCMKNVGLGDLKPRKGYHFPQGYDLLHYLPPRIDVVVMFLIFL
ncbi:hypothetical protein RchiOBHm_Chr5g0008751 [Rosa chinensis]|uniref:Uncharacterized protein n=1 Tax=Rosa chinensis TaxID=74649 RepID=A0A2P6Q454_ROSCH|nr:hypothetical protein RchiOBHm_Chr5g0008751 [Rosa chinensis]